MPTFEKKIIAPENLDPSVFERPLVFTNGCFDLLHAGHVTCLDQAKLLGKTLLVAINDDDSIKRLKGPERPIQSLGDRLLLLAALSSVDYVTWFCKETPYDLIIRLKPEVLVKGGDWPKENIVGAKEVESWGGSVHAIPFIYQRSTSAIVEKIHHVRQKIQESANPSSS
jgi:rfaE bifunctional protein nucleotidyltransferase chain/domain